MTDQPAATSLAPKRLLGGLVEASREAPRYSIATATLLVAILWLITHPYFGIVHDARLYMVQGLSHLQPAAYANDLFFKYGSQDRFSIFGPLLAAALTQISPETVNLILTITSELIWLAAAATLAIVLYRPSWQQLIALGALVALPSDYAAANVFHHAEPFFTPRPFAEAMILLAVAMFFSERWVACGVSCISALILHPLMAAPGVFLIFCMFASKNGRLWILPAATTAALLLLAAGGIEPFSRLSATMSGNWLVVAMDRDPWAFVSRWATPDFLRLALEAAIAASAAPTMSILERRLLMATGITVAAGIFSTVLGADLAHNLFVINLQPARAIWLSSVFVNLIAGAAVYCLFRRRSIARWHLVTALAIYAQSIQLTYLLALALLPLLVSTALVWLEKQRVEYTNFYRRIAFALSSFAALMSLYLAALAIPTIARIPDARWELFEIPVTFAVLLAAALLYIARIKPAIMIAFVGLAFALYAADRRNNWEKFIEGTGPLSRPDRILGNAQNVYWEGGVELMWLRLRRAEYYSCLQGSGVMFYSETAEEYRRRGQVLSALNTIDFTDKPGLPCTLKGNIHSTGPTTAGAIAEVCRKLPELDMMVLLTKVGDFEVPSWKAPAQQSRPLPNGTYDKADTYYFYDCRNIRRVALMKNVGPTKDRGS